MRVMDCSRAGGFGVLELAPAFGRQLAAANRNAWLFFVFHSRMTIPSHLMAIAPSHSRSFILSALSGLTLVSSALAADFRVGAAWVDITPKVGAPMGGYYKFRAMEGVRDPLYAKTIVVEEGGSRAALIVLDHVRTARPIVEAAKKLIQEQC